MFPSHHYHFNVTRRCRRVFQLHVLLCAIRHEHVLIKSDIMSVYWHRATKLVMARRDRRY